MTVRIIILAYNEGKNLGGVLQGVQAQLQSHYLCYVIDDGSTDDTRGVVESLQHKCRIVLISHPTNLGVLHAFRSGIKAVVKDSSDQDVIVLMEGDGTSDSGVLQQIVGSIQAGFDVVIASRYVGNGAYLNFPLKRLLLSKAANLMLRFLFPISGVKDYTHFYRGYKPAALRALLAQKGDEFISFGHYVCNVELLLRLRNIGIAACEVPVRYDYARKAGRSKMKLIGNLLSYLRLVVRYRIGGMSR